MARATVDDQPDSRRPLPDDELASRHAELDQLRAILHGVADGITVQGPDGALRYANLAAATLCGFDSVEAFLAAGREEIVGRFEMFDAEGEPLATADLPGRHALRGERPPPTTIRFRIRSTGEERRTRVTSTPVPDPASGAWLAVNAFHDISREKRAEIEQRDSERRYRRLTDALPQIAWVTDAAGRLTQASARWAAYTGDEPVAGSLVMGALPAHPDDAAGLLEAWQTSIDSGDPFERFVRLRRHDGADLWHLLRAVPLLDDGGRRSGWIGTSTDVDASVRAEASARLLAEANRRLDEDLDLETTIATATGLAVPHLADWCSIDLIEPDGSVRRASVVVADPARQPLADRLRDHPTVLGSERPGARAIAERRSVLLADVDDDVFDRLHAGFPELVDLLRQLGTSSAIATPLMARGSILGVMFLAASDGSRRYGDADVELATELASRVAQGIANARLYSDEQRARAAAESAVARTERLQERERFLADATKLMSSSLDYGETIRRVAELAVPRVADWCVIDLLDDAGVLQPIVTAHVDPGKIELARDYRRRHPPDPSANRGAYGVVRSGRSVLLPELPPQLLDESGATEEERRLVDELQLRSYMAVPLLIGGRVAGVITFLNSASGRAFAEDDLAFAEDLAARAAGAIENARLYQDADRFRRVLDATWDAVNIFDAETLRISYVSDGAVRQLGRPREELLGATPLDFTDGISEAELRELIGPLIEGEVPSRTLNFVRHRPDGARIPVEVLWQYMSFPDLPGQIVAIARDVTDRVEAQRRLEELAQAEHNRAAELNAIIDAIGEGVVVCDATGRITLANAAADQIFPGIGDSTFAEVLGRFEDADEFTSDLLARGGQAELRVRGPVERWIELNASPVLAGASGPDGVRPATETIILLRDVTEARQRQVIRDTFVEILSHELRTPVTTIYAAANILSRPDRTLSEEVRRETFQDIRDEAERLHRLVEDVIALTRFEEGSVDLGHEPVLLQRILPTVARSEQNRWPNVFIRLDLPSDVPPVAADPTYVEQVVRNLLSNAAKYGGPETTIDIRVEVDEHGDVVVRILDQGPGFPPEEADRLFELFYRSPATSAAASGAGIGLFVCARLIAAMNGRIWAAPRPDGGAEFGFALSAMDEDD